MPTTPSSVTSARCLVDKVIDDEEGGDLVQDELTSACCLVNIAIDDGESGDLGQDELTWRRGN